MFYVIDNFFEKYYGPYNSEEDAKKDLEIVKKMSSLVSDNENVFIKESILFLPDSFEEGDIDIIKDKIGQIKSKSQARRLKVQLKSKG